MRRDRRVHFDASTRPFYERTAAEQAKLAAAVPAAAWAAMLPPLESALIARARTQAVNVVPFPPQGEPQCRAAFEALMHHFAGEDDRGGGAMRPVIEEQLARRVAENLSTSPAEWPVVVAALAHGQHWNAFISAVPTAAIEANVEELVRPPRDPADCVQSFDMSRTNVPTVLRTLDEARVKAADTWGWLDTMKRCVDHAMLSTDLALRSGLLARLGAAPWITWVMNLPHALFTMVAINHHVYDLEFLEDVLAHCHEAAAPQAVRETTFLILVRRALELWEQVDRSLERAAVTTYNIEERDRAEYQGWLDAWTNDELPARVDRLVKLVLEDPLAIGAAVTLAKHLRAVRRVAGASEPKVRPMFRDRLLAGMARRDIDAMVAALSVRITAPGLLAAATLVNRDPTEERCRVVLVAYETWLRSEDFFWVSPLDGDDGELAEALASVLSRVKTPVAHAETLLSAVRRPSQGWGFDLQSWFESVPRVAHVLIVAASAAALHHASDAAGSVAAMDLVWAELHALLGTAPVGGPDAHLPSAVAYVWACAAKVFDDPEARLAAALPIIDDLRMLVSAAENFANNIAPTPGRASPMPISAQRIVREALEKRRPILERHPHISAETLTKLSDAVRKVAADAYAENA